MENIRVIEKLVRDFAQAKGMLGEGRVNRRLADRYYRLAKARMKDGRKGDARDALEQMVWHREADPRMILTGIY